MTQAVSQSPVIAAVRRPHTRERDGEDGLLRAERDFYSAYPWCLNPFPTVRETVGHLAREIGRLREPGEDWQRDEVRTNVFLLSCALLNAVDEYLRGKTFRLPRKLASMPFARGARWATEKFGAMLRSRRRAQARQWREDWQHSLDAFLSLVVAGAAADPAVVAAAGDGLARRLQSPLPAELRAEHIYFPSAFRRLDLTHEDVLALGRRFIERSPDRRQPILLVGLRTAGSYFAPLLRASLKAEGYQAVDAVTTQPEKGPGAAERGAMVRGARAGSLAVILDDPPHTGDALLRAVDMLRGAGFPLDRLVILVPAHPARRNWGEVLARSELVVLSLDPDDWHKQRLMDPEAIEGRLTEYYQARGFAAARVVPSAAAERFNDQLQSTASGARGRRLKRVYEIRLRTPDGDEETRYVLAKSVGWGWLGYHAFLAGQRLDGFVPPVLGLRDGILYSEWVVPPTETEDRGQRTEDSQEQWVRATAAYVAARVRSLGLGNNPLPSLGQHRHHDGFRLLGKELSRVYGRFLTADLMQPGVRRRLSALPCPVPTLIDAKMQRSEWVAGPRGPLKTDFEHHGLGKNELNLVDPAYDLAEIILDLGLSPQDEARLIRLYAEQSGDKDVESRLFLNKFLAGTWATASALRSLFQPPQSAERQQESHRQFVDALHFLTVHTARFCGRYCRPPQPPRWRSPLAVLDVDGVIDRRLFGFPCTTASGMQAVALLHAHDFAVTVNTARSVAEVKEYCSAYGFAGGVAEYGSYVWDAVNQRGRAVVSPEPLRQLDAARDALRQIPGVFLDERYQHSILAYTYEDRAAGLGRVPIPGPLRALLSVAADGKAPVPLPTLTVQQLLASRGLDRLCFHQTTLDTTILAKEVNKGCGLTALLEWIGQPDADTVAVGDSEHDLPMFRVARRCYAPAHIGCARLARLIGCRIARRPYQRGLLDIVRSLAHPGGGRCPRCAAGDWPRSRRRDLFLDLLRAADRPRPVSLLNALLDPRAYRVFVR